MQDQKEAMSKIEEIMKTAFMEEGSELQLPSVDFDINEELIFITEDSYGILTRNPSEKGSLMFENVRKTSSADEEDNQRLVVRKRILNFEENLQGSVNVESLKQENSLNLCLNELVSKPNVKTAQSRSIIGSRPGERGR